jgi:hypothetical protein
MRDRVTVRGQRTYPPLPVASRIPQSCSDG